MKDWTGNNHSIHALIHSGNPADREPNDYYATDPRALDCLASKFTIPQYVWEPACGEGHLSKRLKELGHVVFSSDIIDRGFGKVADFLTADFKLDNGWCILTNPPYRHATEFILHALDLLPEGAPAIFLLRTTFLESKSRHDRLFSKGYLHAVYQLTQRIDCALNGDFSKANSAVPYAWFIFRKTPCDNPAIYWI